MVVPKGTVGQLRRDSFGKLALIIKASNMQIFIYRSASSSCLSTL